MKKILVLILVLLSAILDAQVKKSGSKSPFPKSIHKILFLGNSITYQGDYISYIEAYMILNYPDREYEFINVGLPSETVSGLSEEGHAGGQFPRPDLHERLSRVLAQTKPDLVFANYGMNDGIYLPLDERRFHLFRDGILWLHEKLVNAGIKIIHLTPPLYDEKKGGALGYSHVLDTYSNWLLAQRDSVGWNVIDIHTAMADYQVLRQAGDPGFSLAADGVHPGALGHWVMAKQILLYFDAKKELIAADNFESGITGMSNGLEIFKLVDERQKMMKDAWLTATMHKRPGLKAGLPMQDALKKAAEINKRIRLLVHK